MNFDEEKMEEIKEHINSYSNKDSNITTPTNDVNLKRPFPFLENEENKQQDDENKSWCGDLLDSLTNQDKDDSIISF